MKYGAFARIEEIFKKKMASICCPRCCATVRVFTQRLAVLGRGCMTSHIINKNRLKLNNCLCWWVLTI